MRLTASASAKHFIAAWRSCSSAAINWALECVVSMRLSRVVAFDERDASSVAFYDAAFNLIPPATGHAGEAQTKVLAAERLRPSYRTMFG
jgi:hypothetical protein